MADTNIARDVESYLRCTRVPLAGCIARIAAKKKNLVSLRLSNVLIAVKML
jgi:hypothetical protein